MNKLNKKLCCGVLLGLFATSFVPHVHGAHCQTPQPVPTPTLKSILQLELSQTELLTLKPTIDDEGVRTFEDGPASHFLRPVRVGLYKPIQSDLDGDGKAEIVSGFQFLNKGELLPHSDDRDFLAVYAVDKDGHLTKQFQMALDPSDRGYFVDLQLADLTGDGKPEICFRYNFVNAGMIRWHWKEILYIIRGRPPFATLLKLPVREGWQTVKGEGHARRSEVKFKDLNADGTNEMLVHVYQGKDDSDRMKRVTQTPTTYVFLHGHYERLTEPPIRKSKPTGVR